MATLSMVHIGMALLVLLQMVCQFWHTSSFQYLIFACLAVFFSALQLVASRRTQSAHLVTQANWLMISALLLCILVITIFVHNSLLICVYFFAAIPLAVAVTGQLKQLPSVLFLTFISAAFAIMVDLLLPLAPWRLMAQGRAIWLYTGAGFFFT